MVAVATFTSGHLDLYDYGNGDILIAWEPFGGVVPDSYNVYLDGVLYENVAGRTVDQTSPTVDSTSITVDSTVGGSNGTQCLISGLAQTSYSSSAVVPSAAASAAALTVDSTAWTVDSTTYTADQTNQSGTTAGNFGSQRPQNMPPNGVVTQAPTHVIYVTAVVGGVEVAKSNNRTYAPAPSSIMLVTPMKRLWPFPNTGLD